MNILILISFVLFLGSMEFLESLLKYCLFWSEIELSLSIIFKNLNIILRILIKLVLINLKDMIN